MPRQPRQQNPTLAQSVAQAGIGSKQGGGGGGGRGMEQALSNLLETFRQVASNLMQVTQQQQQENALANQEARQSAAGGVTEVLNQVASGIRGRDTTAEDEKTKQDREYQEEYTLWQQELAQKSRRDMLAIQQALKAQEEARTTYLGKYQNDLAVLRESNLANRAKLEQMAEVFFTLPDGAARYAKAMEALQHSEDMYETHQSAPYAAKANQITNEANAEILQSADPLGELQRLQAIDPRLLPLPGVTQPIDKELPTLSWKDRLDWEQGQGYPSSGVQTIDPSMATHVVPYTQTSAIRSMMDDANFRMMVTKEGRKKLKDSSIRALIEAERVTTPLLDSERQYREIFESLAPEAISRGIQDYLADPNPHKRDNMAETLVGKILTHMIPDNGAKFSQDALQMMKGELTINDQKGIALALAVKAAASALDEQLVATQADPTTGIIGGLFNDMVLNNPAGAPAALAQFGLGVQTTGLGASGKTTVSENAVASAHRQFAVLFAKMGGVAGRIKHAAWSQVPVRALYDEVGTIRRLADTYTIVGPSIDETPDYLDEKEATQLLTDVANRTDISPNFRRHVGVLEATGILFQNYPDKVGLLNNIYSGGEIDIKDPNLPTFSSMVDLGKATDPYLNQVVTNRLRQWAGESQQKKLQAQQQQPPQAPQQQQAPNPMSQAIGQGMAPQQPSGYEGLTEQELSGGMVPQGGF